MSGHLSHLAIKSTLLLLTILLVDTSEARIGPMLETLAAFLPPKLRLGLGQTLALREDCKAASAPNGDFQWNDGIGQGHHYQVATCVFRALAKFDRGGSASLWFPAMNDMRVIKGIADVINQNPNHLPGLKATPLEWPAYPASGILLESIGSNNLVGPKTHGFGTTDTDGAIRATEHWVEQTLCRLKLCPYTASMTRAAVGLEAARVKEGPILICHAEARFERHSHSNAAILAALFWEGVAEIATKPETDVATSLLIAPSCYDDDFVGFASVCDDLIEPCVQVTGADSIVGRAWFHPHYDAAVIGHSTVVAGHALPAAVVEGFVNKFERDKEIDSGLIAEANNAVRWTPHATINLLRRSQLTAAKDVEAKMPNKKPNSIYARNVARIVNQEGFIQPAKVPDHSRAASKQIES